MPDFSNPVGSTQRYIAALNRLQNDRVPGTKKFCVDHNDLTQKVDEERSCVGMGLPVWFDGVEIGVKTEPAAVVRRWSLATAAGTPSANAAASHARTVVIGVFSRVLAADTNRVWSSTGAPSSATGANGDLALDGSAGIVYEKASGAWAVLVSMYGGGSTPATAPGAPTIGTATAGNGSISVAFTAPSSNGGAAILDYTVTLSTGQTATGTSSPISVTAPNGTAATATVRARNSVGQGPASAASNSVTPSAGITVPGAPTIGTATAGDASASVTFTAPGSNGGSAITGYRVTASTGQTATGSASPINVTGLTNGTAATFTVQAQNAAGYGAASAASNSVTPAAISGGIGAALTLNPLVNLTAQSSNNYLAASGVASYGAYGRPGTTGIAANAEGWVAVRLGSTTLAGVSLGLYPTADATTTSTALCAMVISVAQQKIYRSANAVAGTSIVEIEALEAVGAGTYYRLHRTASGVYTIQKTTNNGTNWAVIYTFSTVTSTAAVYPVLLCNSDATIYDPRGSGLV